MVDIKPIDLKPVDLVPVDLVTDAGLRAPQTLSAAVDETSGGIELAASTVSGADSYTYYYAIDSGAWQTAATGQDTDYTFTPTEAGEYSFAVTAVKGSSESAKTTWISSGLFDDVPNDEGIALMAFYESTDGDNWGDNTNWMTDPIVGNWYGVTETGGNATKLSLVDNNLNGDITDFQESEFGLGLDLELWDNANLTFSSRFIIKIKTDNAGDSADDTVVIPAAGDFEIDWGDGTVETYTGAAVDDGLTKHTYAAAGEYWAKVSDGLEQIQYNGNASRDKDKIVELRNWGDCVWASLANSYVRCFNLIYSASDLPVLSTADLQANGVFAYCTLFAGNESISRWDVSNVIVWTSAFRETTFNYDLSEWALNADPGNAYLTLLFANSSMSTENYSRTLIGWANQVAANGGPYNVNMDDQDGCTYNNVAYGGSPYDNAVDARAFLTGATAGWTITDDSQV